MAVTRMRGRAPQPAGGGAPNLVKITITLDDHEKVSVIDTTRLPLIFLEALNELTEDGSWRNMRRGIQRLLILTDDEADELTTEHIIQISQAVTGATDIPND